MDNPAIIDRPEQLYLNTEAEVKEVYEKGTCRSTVRIITLSDVNDLLLDNGADTLVEVRVRAAGKRFVYREENRIWRWEMR